MTATVFDKHGQDSTSRHPILMQEIADEEARLARPPHRLPTRLSCLIWPAGDERLKHFIGNPNRIQHADML